MNYLAHGLSSLGDPYETAGAATPDWLCLTTPRLRCRSRHAAPFVDSSDQELASLARGVMRHHAEDAWFHQTTAFLELSAELSREVRRATGDADGMRPSFLGHIVVEMLLDDAIMEQDMAIVDDYYATLSSLDSRRAAEAISLMSGSDASSLAGIIDRFRELAFLYDYRDDERLTFRLNQVLRRVKLPSLPASFMEILPAARRRVAARREELLTPLPAAELEAPAGQTS